MLKCSPHEEPCREGTTPDRFQKDLGNKSQSFENYYMHECDITEALYRGTGNSLRLNVKRKKKKKYTVEEVT